MCRTVGSGNSAGLGPGQRAQELEWSSFIGELRSAMPWMMRWKAGLVVQNRTRSP